MLWLILPFMFDFFSLCIVPLLLPNMYVYDERKYEEDNLLISDTSPKIGLSNILEIQRFTDDRHSTMSLANVSSFNVFQWRESDFPTR